MRVTGTIEALAGGEYKVDLDVDIEDFAALLERLIPPKAPPKVKKDKPADVSEPVDQETVEQDEADEKAEVAKTRKSYTREDVRAAMLRYSTVHGLKRSLSEVPKLLGAHMDDLTTEEDFARAIAAIDASLEGAEISVPDVTAKLRPYAAEIKNAASAGDPQAKRVIKLYELHQKSPHDPMAAEMCEEAFDVWFEGQPRLRKGQAR